MVAIRWGPFSKEELHAQAAIFEKKLAQCPDDPLDIWSGYIEFTLDHQPQNATSVLARAAKDLTECKRYHGDVRLLRLWCRFAFAQQKVAPHEMIGSLYQQGVGIQHPLMYESWAGDLEKNHKFAQVSTVYKMGLQHVSDPKGQERLHDGIKKFAKRMEQRKQRDAKKRKQYETVTLQPDERGAKRQKVPSESTRQAACGAASAPHDALASQNQAQALDDQTRSSTGSSPGSLGKKQDKLAFTPDQTGRSSAADLIGVDARVHRRSASREAAPAVTKPLEQASSTSGWKVVSWLGF